MAEQNIALNRPTLTSSFVKPYESARAVNGMYGATSRWLCNSLPGWLMVDLGVNGSYYYFINRWVVRHMSCAGWQSPNYNMSDFKLQGSNNNSTWYDIDSVVGNTIGITDRTLVSAVAYRYVRLYVTKGLLCNPRMASAMEFEVYQSPPLSAYLQTGTGLTVGGLTLSPAFVNNTFNYTTPNVANSVTSVAVTPTVEDSRATIMVNGVVVASGNTTNVALNTGSNAISIQVTAADGITTKTYTVTVVRDAPIAQLNGLSINPGTFNETFSPSTLNYTANLGYDVESVTVTPSTNISGATITVNSVNVASGTASGNINLNVGINNVISVVVTNGTATKTYTITVTRVAGLTLSAAAVVGTVSTPITLQPFYTPNNVMVFVGTIEYSDSNFNIQNITVTPSASPDVAIKYLGNPIASGTPVTINSPVVGDTDVNFTVSALDGTGGMAYTARIKRNNSTFLKSIASTPGTVSPAISKGISFAYTVKVTGIASKTTLALTAEDPLSKISLVVDSTTYNSVNNTLSQLINVTSVAKTATVTVLSATGIPSNVYTISLSK